MHLADGPSEPELSLSFSVVCRLLGVVGLAVWLGGLLRGLGSQRFQADALSLVRKLLESSTQDSPSSE